VKGVIRRKLKAAPREKSFFAIPRRRTAALFVLLICIGYRADFYRYRK